MSLDIESPPPFSTAPYPRDPDFVEIGSLITQVDIRCTSPAASPVLLLGEGGTGKSHLAIEYSYRVREREPDTWVLWIDSGSTARFEQSCANVAARVKAPGYRNLEDNKFRILCSWLKERPRRKWILILDHVDIQLFNKTGLNGPSSILELLHSCPNGSLIMTTRKADVLEQFERPWELVFVHRMEVSPAQTWLETKLGRRETDPGKVGMALEELTFLQLGIMVAAAYINYRGANYSVEQYVDDLCNGEFSALTIAGHVEPHLNMRESLFTPCQLSIEYLLDVRPSAVDVLFRASFFDEQGIPEYLLRSQPEYDECANINETDVSDTSSFTIMDGFEDDIQILKDFSLITTDITGKTLRMHSLIQESTKKWLQANGDFDKWQQIFLNKMYNDFPVPYSSTLGTCQLLFPHVQKAIAHPPNTYSSESFTEWVALVYKASTFACQCCNVEAAEKLIQLAIDEQTKQLGPNDPSVLATEDLMGELYCSVRQWQRAEALSTDVVAKSREILGHEHPDTLRRQAKLIQLYSKQGRYQDAEAGYIELVTTSKLVWGFQHPDTLEYLSKLAAVLAMQEKWVAAEIALKEAVNGSIQSLGEGHTETLERMKSLVRIFMAQGRARALEAEALQIQVVDICRAVCGSEHVSTVDSMHSLIDMHLRANRWVEAEALQLHVLEVQRNVLGEDHLSTLASMDNLVFLCLKQDRLRDAEAVQRKIMETSATQLGVNHYLTQRAVYKLDGIREKIAESERREPEEPEKWL